MALLVESSATVFLLASPHAALLRDAALVRLRCSLRDTLAENFAPHTQYLHRFALWECPKNQKIISWTVFCAVWVCSRKRVILWRLGGVWCDLCKKACAKKTQKRSFCTAIPIVLHAKGCRFALQTYWFCALKPIVLGQRTMIFAPKQPSGCCAEALKRRF